MLTAGYPVIVDATCLKRSQREEFYQLAVALHVPLLILDFPLSEAELRRRILQRTAAGTDISEANVEVLKYQRVNQQPLNESEREQSITIRADTSPEEVATYFFEQVSIFSKKQPDS